MLSLLKQALTAAAAENPATVAFWALVIVTLTLVLTYLLLRDAVQALAPVLHTYAETRRTPRPRATGTAKAPRAHGWSSPVQPGVDGAVGVVARGEPVPARLVSDDGQTRRTRPAIYRVAARYHPDPQPRPFERLRG